MAYCSNCGAYIPDGQTVCPSCGLDINEPPKAPELDLDTAPKAAEKQKTSTSERTGETPTAEKPVSEEAKKTNGRLFAILSYVSILCLLPFLFCPDDQFAKYHGRQGILLVIVSGLIDVLSGIIGSSVVTLVLSLFRLYLMIKGMTNASAGKMEPLPYVGKYAEKF